MAKRLGTDQNSSDGQLKVECLKGLDDQEAAERVAQFFSHVSNEYSPLDISKLPAYLPAAQQLKVEKDEVAKRIFSLKNRRSTQPVDLPSKLRKLFASELATPLTDIINSC